MSRATSSRFRRPETPRPIKVQDDDRTLMWHMYRNRLIESSCLYSLLPNRSDQGLSRRLDLLFDNGYVDRLPGLESGKAKTKTPGTKHFLYMIDNKGARDLRNVFKSPVTVDRWASRNAGLSDRNIPHHIETTRFVTKLTVGAHKLPDARILHLDQLMSDDLFSKRPLGLQRNTLRADVQWPVFGHEQGTSADTIVAPVFGDEGEILFVEIDRGTETIVPGERIRRSPRFWSDTSFLRKMVIYAAAFRAREHLKQFGFKSFRVLTVTTNAERVETMQSAYEQFLSHGELHVPPGLFLYTHWPDITNAENVLTMPLQTASGRGVTLA